MKRLFLIANFTFCCVGLLHATNDTLYPEIGKPCTDFILKNVDYYNKKEVTFADFKGKWLVLDFWSKTCISCIQSFPEVNAMQKEFGDRVQFMLVGIQDPKRQIKTMYERFQSRLNLKLPCAFDSSLSNYWGIINTPHIIIIDDKGIVQARTFKLKRADIETFLKGGHPDLSVIPFVAQRKNAPDIGEQRIPFDDRKPYMVNGNGAKSETEFLFRSVLTKWDQATQYSLNPPIIDMHSIDPSYPKGMVQATGASLSQLYLGAYFGAFYWSFVDTSFYGKFSRDVILELADSSLFLPSMNGKNMFCYSLIMPAEKASRENLQKAMQRDLETYFGFNVSIEKRKVFCWRLVAEDGALTKLATKGGEQKIEEILPRVSYKFLNVPMRRFLQYLNQFSQDKIFVDDTGTRQNIDITTTECLDLNSMRAFLPKYGLKLVPGEKEMKVLVIRDANK